MTDDHFLQALAATAGDDGVRLAYSDWLEERGDVDALAKAEFLRLTVKASKSRRKGGSRKDRKRLQELAAALDTDWLAVVSRLAIENCPVERERGTRGQRLAVRFNFLCERRWEELRPTEDHAQRFCDSCQERVYYCDTIVEARQHARLQHCIAIDLGIPRRTHDWRPELRKMGRIMTSQIRLERERQRVRPDAVSLEREQRKQARNSPPPGG